MKVTQLADGSLGDKRYYVENSEKWGYARWPATVSVDKNGILCCGRDCASYSRKFKDFECKHVKTLKNFLHIS